MFPLAAVAFFASGFAALLYQVIWQRLLVVFSGADVYSATLIVAAFMAGLGVGSFAGGEVADRISRPRALLFFGGCELAIGMFGWLSRTLYYDVLYLRLGSLPLTPPVIGTILFVSLLWPTFFMGASLPLLSRALTQSINRAASTVGVLYGLNTLGAAVGAVVATWVVLPLVGLEGGLRIGAALNVGCAALILPIAWRSQVAVPAPPLPSPSVPANPGGAALGFGLWTWVAIAALSGLLSLSLEILWFRMFGVMMKATAFTFGTLLALYLSGIGLGALIGSRRAPLTTNPGRAFLLTQAAVPLSAAFLVIALTRRVDNTPVLWSYLANYEPLNVRECVSALIDALRHPSSLSASSSQTLQAFLLVYVAVPAVLILPPTFLMGYGFPLLQRVVQTDLATIGRRTGTVMLANVLGCMAGTMLTGWVGLDRVGTAGTLRVIVGASSVFTILVLVRAAQGGPRPARRTGVMIPLGALAAACVGLLLLPTGPVLWTRLHGTTPEHAIIGEDGSGLSLIKVGTREATVFVNGIGQSVLPYGDIHTALGALPAFVHPGPRTAAVIGLGSGDTVHAVAGRREIERVTCVEIVRPRLASLSALSRQIPFEGLVGLLRDPRISHVFDDGRIFLMRSPIRYDIIEADALRPGSAYSGNLYSIEYFRLLRDRLAPGGIAATWAPTQRVYNTFITVFPHVISANGLLLGSLTPIVLDRPLIDQRLKESRASAYYEISTDIEALMATYLAAPAVYGPEFPRADLTDLDTDLFPKDEYDLYGVRR